MSFQFSAISKPTASLPRALMHPTAVVSLRQQQTKKAFLVFRSITAVIFPNRTQNIRVTKRNFSNEASNSGSRSTCSCSEVLRDKIKELIQCGNKDGLKRYVLGNCRQAKNLKDQWRAYSPGKHDLASDCKAQNALKFFLTAKVRGESHVKGVGKLDDLRVDLSALTMESGKVSLAGEGGAVVGKKEYWRLILEILQDKERPLNVISVGGGTGSDGRAIATVFKDNGLTVRSCKIIDPNLLAAWLSSANEVVFYAATAQEYFGQFFAREKGDRYIFHLGTLLNVVSEVAAVDILQVLAKNMSESDILSVIMVDEKQFANIAKKKYITCIDSDHSAGLARYVYSGSGDHYKTIIRDRNKFLNFCEKLGLRKIDFAETKESAMTVVQVTFVAFKGIKLGKENPR